MLEGGGCSHACILFQLLYQLPAVKGVKEVDISRSSVDYGYRKLSLG